MEQVKIKILFGDKFPTDKIKTGDILPSIAKTAKELIALGFAEYFIESVDDKPKKVRTKKSK